MNERDAGRHYMNDLARGMGGRIDAEPPLADEPEPPLDVETRRVEPAPRTRAMTGGEERTIELREEQLIVHRDLRELGEVVVSTEVEEVPGRVEVDAASEEVEIEHIPVGRFVSERVAPWEEGDALMVPVYEEQVVVTKRLLLREQIRIRRIATTQHQVFEDTLRRDRLVVDAPQETEMVHERYPSSPAERRTPRGRADLRARETVDEEDDERDEGGLLGNLVRRALQ